MGRRRRRGGAPAGQRGDVAQVPVGAQDASQPQRQGEQQRARSGQQPQRQGEQHARSGQGQQPQLQGEQQRARSGQQPKGRGHKHQGHQQRQGQQARRRGCDHVFFIGFLGAGKTTVARNLGNMFHRRFIDVDRMVERELHASVTRIFHTQGEDAFRDAETAALKSLRGRKSLLVSCGGGVIERPENARLMREMGKIVYLDGTLEDSLRQIRRPDKRPDLGDEDHARKLYAHRRPLYESACDYRVVISGKSFEQVAYEVGELLWERGLL